MSAKTMILTDAAQDRAMAVLEQEQQAILPSQWQKRFYYLFNLAQWSLISSILVFLIMSGFYADEIDMPLPVDAVLWVVLALSAVTIPLFFLNLPLVWKLWRHARLRRHRMLRDRL